MKRYVLCYARPIPLLQWQGVLLIEKARPDWQKGLYNLPGGHVEEGETFVDAAVRELQEETGIKVMWQAIKLLGVITGEGWECQVFDCPFHISENADAIQGRFPDNGDERLFWMPFKEANNSSGRLITNLRVVIPLCMAGSDGWMLEELVKEDGTWTLHL